MAKKKKTKTVKVWALVLVDCGGDWVSWEVLRSDTSSQRNRTKVADDAIHCLDDSYRPYWLTVEVPVPTKQEQRVVEAKVKNAGKG